MTKEPNTVKNWKPWYDTVLAHYILGLTAAEIAPIVNKHTVSVQRVVRSEEFKKRYKDLSSKHVDNFKDAMQYLEQHKMQLLQAKIELAMQSSKDSVKAACLSWLLERFPELAPKNVPLVTQQTHVYQHSNEDTDRMNRTAEKLRKVADVLRNGNPFVEDLKQGEEGNTELNELQDNKPSEPEPRPEGRATEV